MKKSVFKGPENSLKSFKLPSSPPSRLISLNHQSPNSLKRNFTIESPNVSRQKLKIKNSLLKKHEILRDSRNNSESSKRGSSSSSKLSLKNYINSSWLLKKPLFSKNSEQLLIAQMNLNTSTFRKKTRLQINISNHLKKHNSEEESEESSEICLPFLKAKLYYPSRESFC